MCDPISIGSAVLTIGGTFMQMQAQKKAQKSINNAINANAEANNRLRDQSQKAVMDSAQNFSRENFDRNEAAETDKVRTKLMSALTPGELPGEFYGGRQDENTRAYAEKRNTEENDFSKQMAEALAKLRGFGQGQIVNTSNVQRAGEVVGLNQNKEAGNNAILPLQIEAAKQKGSTPLGDIFVGLGSAGLTSGLSGGGSSNGFLGSQGPISRTIATGSPNTVGPIQGFGGWNLV